MTERSQRRVLPFQPPPSGAGAPLPRLPPVPFGVGLAHSHPRTWCNPRRRYQRPDEACQSQSRRPSTLAAPHRRRRSSTWRSNAAKGAASTLMRPRGGCSGAPAANMSGREVCRFGGDMTPFTALCLITQGPPLIQPLFGLRLQVVRVVREHLGAVLRDEDDVLEADTAVAGAVEA